jgi:hypothetical protein
LEHEKLEPASLNPAELTRIAEQGSKRLRNFFFALEGHVPHPERVGGRQCGSERSMARLGLARNEKESVMKK